MNSRVLLTRCLFAMGLAPAVAFSQIDPNVCGSRLYIFNPNHDLSHKGERDEFSTIANLERFLSERNLPKGHIVTAIGDQVGTVESAIGESREVIAHWVLGSASQWVYGTVPETGHVTELDRHAPIAFTQVSVLNPKDECKIKLSYLPEEAGTVLWNFRTDATSAPVLDWGVHNMFNHTDDGLTSLLHDFARGKFERLPTKLARLEAALGMDGNLWDRFSSTNSRPAISADWMNQLKKRGFAAAGIMMNGDFSLVHHMRVTENNQSGPADSKVKMFARGRHFGPLQAKFAQEVDLGVDTRSQRWTMFGFLLGMPAAAGDRSTQDRKSWIRSGDAFGGGYHVHGYRDDLRMGGHILGAATGREGVAVDIYPIDLDSAGRVFNNDLKLLPDTLSVSSETVSVELENDGENFVRNVVVRLQGRTKVDGRIESLSKKFLLLNPGERVRVSFDLTDKNLTDKKFSRNLRIQLDPDGRFIEGGQGKSNNLLELMP